MAKSKIILRTKTSAAIDPADLQAREMVYGNDEQSIFVKNTAEQVKRFMFTDDAVTSTGVGWSAQKVHDTLTAALIAKTDLTIGDSSVTVTDTGVDGKFEIKLDNTVAGTYTKDGLMLKTGSRITAFSTDETLSGESDLLVPTERAVKTYIDSLIGGTRKALTGRQAISNGASYVTVVFDEEQLNTDYTISTTIVNTVDPIPSIYIGTVSEKLTTGFTIDLSGDVDSASYSLEWVLDDTSTDTGQEAIPDAVTTVIVTLPEVQANIQYSIDVNLTNIVDALPSVYDMEITAKSTTAFIVTFSGTIDSANYVLEWMVDRLEDMTGQATIPNDANSITVNFATAKTSTSYIINSLLVNTSDPTPSLYAYMVTDKTINGFTVIFSGTMDSANYKLDWICSNLVTNIMYQDGSISFTSPVSGVWPTLDSHLATKEYIDKRIIAGRQQLLTGDYTKTITLPETMPNTDYTIGIIMSNLVDDFSGTPDGEGWVTTPVSYDFMITGRTTTNFTITFSEEMDTDNYYIEWFVRRDTM